MATRPVYAEKPDIPNTDLDLGIAEVTIKASLQNLPGILGVLLVGRGAFVRYNSNAINDGSNLFCGSSSRLPTQHFPGFKDWEDRAILAVV